MTLAVRSELFGSSTLLIDSEKVHNLSTKFTYSTWHPTGRIIVSSINKVGQFFNFSEDEVRNVVDLNSMLAYYNLKTGKIKTIPAFSKKDTLETYPAFSADGKYLYYSNAQRYWTDDEKLPPNRYDNLKYNLMRISYDIEKDVWGTPETIVSSEETQKSALEARTSPDGRWLLFCMCDYGCFPAYRPSSDLYLIDLKKAEQTGVFTPEKISANSDKSESWHSFSDNSRWIAFSSKSLRARLTVTKFCYLDDKGQTTKPFVMPQKNPGFYNSFTMTFSVPEFTTTPIKVTREKLGKAIRASRQIPIDLPTTMATPGKDSPPWSLRE
jgi:Tol biopolymer transport system component